MVEEFVILTVLIFLSGFFSAAETALFSISKAKAIHIAKANDKVSRLIKKMKDDPHRLLSTILIGNNVVNVGAASFATAISMELFPNHAVGFVTGSMTMIILIFGEIFPKSISTHNNIMVSKVVIFPLFWLSIIFFPLIVLLNFIPMILGKLSNSPKVTEEELITMVEVVEGEGEIKEVEKELIYNIFEFDDISASEIMTPRTDMFVIDISDKFDLQKICKHGFSRIPIIDDKIDNIAGILHIKDIFKYYAVHKSFPEITQIMTKPYFVPESKKIDTILLQFKERKHHLFIVVDEYGGVSGLVTLEDVIEEIIGDISDETDKEEKLITKMKNKIWLVLGKIDIDNLNEQLELDIPESGEYDTFSGYVLEKIGRIPKEKEKITLETCLITVNKMDGNRIVSFIVEQKIATSKITTSKI